MEDDRKWRVVSDTTAGGFTFPESVGCDATERVLYVSNFGGTELKPAEKDGKGFISKVGLDGKVIQARVFPGAGETLHKPKGLWIEGSRLWVTDVDAVWIYDTKTRKGRKLDIPGIKFANDPAVGGGALYVTDNRSDQVFRIEPADFLDAKVTPKITVAASGKAMSPNGVWPARDGTLRLVGFQAPDQPRAIYSLDRSGNVKALSQPIGRLDGVYEMPTARCSSPTGTRARSSAGARRAGRRRSPPASRVPRISA
jgi:sugar lactone lactonase YvrE